MGKRGHILESSAEKAGGYPAGKVENPAGLRRHTVFKEIGVKTENAASGKLSLIVDGKQERIGIHVDVECVGRKVAGVDVIHHGVGIQGVEEQVQQLDEQASIGGRADEIGLNRLD